MDPEQPSHQRRWSMSTATTSAPTPSEDVDSAHSQTAWPLPPVPPVPESDAGMASWRRRSLKRDSYISQTQQIPSTFAHTIRENHRQSICAGGINDFSQRPQSTYRPLAGRARDIQDRAAQSQGALWTQDKQNPQNWSSSRKALQSAAALVAVLSLALSSSVLTPITEVVHSHNQPISISVLPHAIFALGLAFVPLTAAVRDLYGRRIVLAAALCFYGVFSLIAAFARHHIAVVIAMRLLAGCAASPILAFSPSILMDLFAAGQRTVPTILYAAAIAAGTSIGPLLGGIAIETRSPAWAQYIILFTIGGCLALVCCMQESSKEAILRAKSDIAVTTRLSHSLKQPFRILISEFTLWSSTVCIAVYAATGLGLVQAVPIIFQDTYAFGLTSQGCVLVSLICGVLVSMICFAVFHLLVYMPKRTAWEDRLATEIEKAMTTRGRPKSRRRSASAKKLKRNSVYRQSSAQMRSSSAVSLRRVSTAPVSPSEEKLPPASTLAMNAGLAVAIAQELNATPANEGKHITPERIWTLSSDLSTFEQLMDELVLQFDVSLDRLSLLQLYDTWCSQSPSTAYPDTTAQHASDQQADSHRAAALAALEKDPSMQAVEAGNADLTRRHSRLMPTASFSQQRPPAHWRLPLALPGAVLATGGIFTLAWTVQSQVHWIAPVIGLAAFGCGAFLNAICACLFLTDRYGADDTVNAVIGISAISYLLAFAFSMFTVPIYQGIGIEWATSIYGFVTLAAWPASLALLRSKS